MDGELICLHSRKCVIRSFEYRNHSISCSVVICEEKTFFKAVSRKKLVKIMWERDIPLSHVLWIPFDSEQHY